jgi:hypothetical protein
VEGWGRVHAVERLRRTGDEEIRDWILRHGFRNKVMNEYLAYIAATTGRLLDRLEEPDPDEELIAAVGEIISVLVAGGPPPDIDGRCLRGWLRASSLIGGHRLLHQDVVAKRRERLDRRALWTGMRRSTTACQ